MHECLESFFLLLHSLSMRNSPALLNHVHRICLRESRSCLHFFGWVHVKHLHCSIFIICACPQSESLPLFYFFFIGCACANICHCVHCIIARICVTAHFSSVIRTRA